MKKPILLVIMDGVGFSKTGLGDAVTLANTPTLDRLLKTYPNARIKAHGPAVGLPSDDDMGNSEVGHNALGCGQIYSQGAKLVNESILSGKIYTSSSWKEVISNVLEHNSTLHFLGLLSDGNVHSNISHLIAMIKEAKKEGVKKVRIHVLLDGRDVPSTSALLYVDQLEEVLKELNDDSFNALIASGGGRMKITMDRYQANWKMVEEGWHTHVLGEGKMFENARSAIEEYRKEYNVIDQDLPAFVIGKDGQPVGKIVDDDSVVLFNFRGDRAIEISMAFDQENFDKFDRVVYPKVVYAGLLQYDGDLKLPRRFLVNPPEIKDTLTEVLVKNNINEYAISETQKFGHVTYFWNGNRSAKVSEELETWVEIPSDNVSFDERPWMKSAQITDEVIKALKEKKYEFLRLNYPNGDMVGHTGSLDATICAMEAVDLSLARLEKVCKEEGYTMIVTADHGNADEMLEKNKKGEVQVRTAHSLNPVPFIIVDDDNKYEIAEGEFGLANVAPTIVKMLGLEAPATWEKPIIK
ncbi:MAG: 2,3-bisphosphoglycerate-independent phosphoglycerate mutase [Bacilli bacterium]|nr:2,3-bisphosphoglycerate-independent phosphoglycerate mutase [Bacillales bacterium]MDY2575733.1 2,3-bisphosphoglycerate-independent phosphoglycerate mutase [Bacilli bacterium]